MELIPSFRINHNLLLPGIYVSRIDTIGSEYATTFDIRMKRPNAEPAVHPNAMHTIEHIVATYLRNDPVWKDQVIYWGPMGCLTGCYLIMKGRPTPSEIAPLIIAAFEYCTAFTGKIPGTEPENCGNYILHDLAMAKWESARYAETLKKTPNFEYPTL